ncbi:MAG: HAD hydrolase-like protein [Chloroflexi bacterium]|nr:HAD hydrolase-like protein [Chloroflexota bacterium]
MVQTTTLDALIRTFKVILFDSDGVLARWPGAVPGAPEAIDRLNSLNKPYFVLTNDASALPETRATRYRELALDIDADRIITAGSLLSGHFSDLAIAGSRCVVLGTEDSADYVRAAGGEVVSFEDDFDVLVIGDQLGFPFLEATGTVLTNLFRKVDRGETPHLVLPNPDVIYPEGEGFGFASGAVALMFEAAIALRYPARNDLVFSRLGKPHPAMFEEAFRRSGTRDAVMIGDTPGTDIRGANQVGIASVLMGTGVAIADPSKLPETDRPTYLMASLEP